MYIAFAHFSIKIFMLYLVSFRFLYTPAPLPPPQTPPAQKWNSAYTEDPLEEATARARCVFFWRECLGQRWPTAGRTQNRVSKRKHVDRSAAWHWLSKPWAHLDAWYSAPGWFQGIKVIFVLPQNEWPGRRLCQDFNAEGGEDTRSGEPLGGARRRNKRAEKKAAQMSVGFTVRADRTPDAPSAGNISRTANAPGFIKPKLSESCQIWQVRNSRSVKRVHLMLVVFARFLCHILIVSYLALFGGTGARLSWRIQGMNG